MAEPVTVTKREEAIAQEYIKQNFDFDINDINHFIDQEMAKQFRVNRKGTDDSRLVTVTLDS